MMQLHVLQHAMSGQLFRNEQPWSIALDGCVNEPPWVDLDTHHINFNHHDGVARLETRSTCAQVLMAIRMGLMQSGPWEHVWVNDCDEDVCLSWWMLKHHYLVDHQNPVLSRLVAVADMLDTTGGSYPIPLGMPILGQVAWIFDPYRRARRHGDMNQTVIRSVIEDVEQRIMRHIVGSGESIPVEGGYSASEMSTPQQPVKLALVREVGPYARNRMLADGLHAFISVISNGTSKFANGGERPWWRYTIGRLNPYVKFPLDKVWAALNVAEYPSLEVNAGWGGGDMIGGSPRPHDSSSSPIEVLRIVREAIR